MQIASLCPSQCLPYKQVCNTWVQRMALLPVKTEPYSNSTCTDVPIVTCTATCAVGIIPEVELPEWLMASGWVMGWARSRDCVASCTLEQ